MTKNVSATPEDLAAVALGMKCLFVAVLIFGIALPTALLIWQSVTPDMVIKRAVAGQFVFASTGSGFLQPSTTTVTTAQGSLIVVGLFSAPRNQPLEVVQWSQKSGLELCAVGRSDTCLPMAGSWAGTLQPTRAQAFDFQKHGLGSDHLTLWLLVGFSLSLMTGVGWFSAHRDAEKLARGSRAPPAIGGGRTPDASSDLLRSCPSSLASRLPQPPQPLSGTRSPAAMTATSFPTPSRTSRSAISHSTTCAVRQTGAVSVGGICSLFSLAIVLPSAVLLLMLHFTAPVVTSTGDAGTFQSAVSSKDLTNVRTSVGILTVSGGFSAPTGQALLLRYSNKRGLQLCPVANLDACAEVTGPWAGRMQPAKYVHHWYTIDYARHGLDSRNLLGILLMGILTLLASLLAWTFEVSRQSDAAKRQGTEHASNA